MRIILLLLFLLLFAYTYAQPKHDYQWLFGFGNSNGSTIDFNTNPSSVYFEQRTMNIGLMNSSICDEDGNLLFYTNGCYIADASHEQMINGDSLNPGELHILNCNFGYRLPQGLIILPDSELENKYMIFHKGAILETEPIIDIIANKLYLTEVDISLNNGLGGVTVKNKIIINDSLDNGQLTGVKHINNIDWWLLTPQDLNNKYYNVLYTPNGVDTIIEQQIGLSTSPQGSGGGQAVFSPDGTKYVRYNPADDVFIFDFDRSTGLLSNFLHIPIEDEAFTGGVAISPNSRYLYISSQLLIYQFDLQAEDIAGSKITVAEYDGFVSPFPATFYQMQLAPDCRIYINSANGIDVLHTINYPDNSGLACEVTQHSIQLPTNHLVSLPNFPNYRLGVGPVCDTSFITATEQPVLIPSTLIKVFPNPAADFVQLEILVPLGKKGEWLLYDVLGNLIFRKSITADQEAYSLSLENVESGIYLYKVAMEDTVLASGKLVVE